MNVLSGWINGGGIGMDIYKEVALKVMQMADYDAVMRLMQHSGGVVIREADSREQTERYLLRNLGLSFVAVSQQGAGDVVGCAMCGHDGRRGYLQHVVVDGLYRRRGIARALVERCLKALLSEGIFKCHLDVLAENHAAQAYWTNQGWMVRTDIYRYSYVIWGGGNV